MQSSKDQIADDEPIARPDWNLDVIVREWPRWAASQTPDLASKLGSLRPLSVEVPDLLVIQPIPGYNWLVDACERPELRLKIESALRGWFGRAVEIRFVRPEEAEGPAQVRHPAIVARDDGLNDDPFIKLIVERFEAKPVRMEREDDSAPGPG